MGFYRHAADVHHAYPGLETEAGATALLEPGEVVECDQDISGHGKLEACEERAGARKVTAEGPEGRSFEWPHKPLLEGEDEKTGLPWRPPPPKPVEQPDGPPRRLGAVAPPPGERRLT